MKDIADKYKVGDRFKLIIDGHRGTISYIGRIPDLNEGFYVGVTLDEPFGLNNGSLKGVKYFVCGDKHGMFLRPDKIVVGDFPEKDIFDEDSDEVDEI